MQHSKRLVVLDHICRVFEIGVRYHERECNAYLRAFHPDTAALRRYLVDEGFLAREKNVYWRTGGSVDAAPSRAEQASQRVEAGRVGVTGGDPLVEAAHFRVEVVA